VASSRHGRLPRCRRHALDGVALESFVAVESIMEVDDG
jgi:hypothetical protein